jgi:hypothetical protein
MIPKKVSSSANAASATGLRQFPLNASPTAPESQIRPVNVYVTARTPTCAPPPGPGVRKQI